MFFRTASHSLRILGLVAALAVAAAASPAGAEPDLETARTAWKLGQAGQWRQARELAERSGDPLLGKVFRWLSYTRAEPDAGFDEIARFIRDNGHWPQQALLRLRAEGATGFPADPRGTVDWFERHRPVGTAGKTRHGEALIALGRRDAGAAILREVWVDGDLGSAEEKEFLRDHRALLTRDDHVRRLDRLLWDGRAADARRMLPLVDEGHRALAEARIALRAAAGGVDKALSRVPAALSRDPGLIYEKLQWRRRKGRDQEARELLLDFTAAPVRPALWWRERNLVARKALEMGHISEAYRVAAGHGVPARESGPFSEAEWLAGWIALRFLEDKTVARQHFERMHEAVNFPVSRSRAAYWAGRAAEATADGAAARAWFGRAAAFPSTFYGQLAQLRLDPKATVGVPADPKPSAEMTAEFEKTELAHAAALLAAVSPDAPLRPFLYALADMRKEPEWKALAARKALALERPELAVALSKRAASDGIDLRSEGFPVLRVPSLPDGHATAPPEAALVLSVVRQESAFAADAVSSAGARGLMQLMPATASKVAGALDVRHSPKKLTEDPDHNLLLGQAYLSKVLDEFQGSRVLALAAYNAGPSRARAWMRQNGDPRDATVDPVDWIEMIPFAETRNYVQRVMENLQVYRARLGKDPVPLRLDADIRG